MLRFMTCGAVDNGKSTLLGCLLNDANAIMKDRAVDDLAHVFDGLEEERAKGITIDVAYGFFSTKKRKFMMVDAPGHAEFLPNMVTAATQIDVAILLIDAQQGLSMQTYKHSEVLDLIGVKKVIVAINKMDLVEFSQDRFLKIQAQFDSLPYQFEKFYIPVVAQKGDNVIYKSRNLTWYKGSPLLATLETMKIPGKSSLHKTWTLQYKDEDRYCGLDHDFKAGDPVFSSKGLAIIQESGDQCMKLDIALERGDSVSTHPIKVMQNFYTTVLGFENLEKETEYIIQFQHKKTTGRLKAAVPKNQFIQTQLYLDESVCYDHYALMIHPKTFKTVGLLKINPSIFWFTGRSGAGKTTLALEVSKDMRSVIVLDADQVRATVSTDLSLNKKGRQENVRRIAEMAYLLADQGYRVFVMCIAPYRKQREQLKGSLPMAEIFVEASLEECTLRDPKGLYAKGIGGNSPYEEPKNPDLRLPTHALSIAECVQKIKAHFHFETPD